MWGPIAWIHTDWGFGEPCWRDVKTGELTCANNRCDGGAGCPGFTCRLDQPAAGQVLRRGRRVSPVSSPLPCSFLLSSFGDLFLSFSLLSFVTQPPVGFCLAVFFLFFLSVFLLTFFHHPALCCFRSCCLLFFFLLSPFFLSSPSPLWVFFLLPFSFFFFPFFLSFSLVSFIKQPLWVHLTRSRWV